MQVEVVLALRGIEVNQFTMQRQMLLKDLVLQFCGVAAGSDVQILISSFSDGSSGSASGRRLLTALEPSKEYSGEHCGDQLKRGECCH